MKKLPAIRVGIAGYGGFARLLHTAWNELEGVEVVAAATLRAPPEGVRVYEHWDGLVHDEAVDLVAIATPPNLHAAVAEAAMEAGKHVLIEKSVATAIADAHRLLATRDRTGRVATVDFMMRFTPIAEALARWKDEKPFGRLRRVVIENHALDESLPAEHWFWDPAQSGGILVEHAVHFFDLIASLTDAQPARVDGWSHSRSSGLKDRMMATVCYDDGLAATQYHTFSRPGFFERTTIRLWFDLAEVEMLGWFPLQGKIYALTNAATESALAMLPHFTETERRPVGGKGEALPTQVKISGEPFAISDEVEGSFDVRTPKMEVYADAVRGLLDDMRRAIAEPEHGLRVPLEAGVEALRLALEASREAPIVS